MKTNTTKVDELWTAVTLAEGQEWPTLGRSLKKLGKNIVDTFAQAALAEMGVMPTVKSHHHKRHPKDHRHHPSHHYRAKGLSAGTI